MKFIILAFFMTVAVQAEIRTKIAVIDTGLKVTPKIKPYLCKTGHASTIGKWNQDIHGHGSNVAGLIADNINVRTHCLIIIKVFQFSYLNGKMKLINSNIADKHIALAIKHSIKQNVKFINMSIESGEDRSSLELTFMNEALRKKIHIILSAGNKGLDLDKKCNHYPICYAFKNRKFLHIIGSSTGSYSNRGFIVNKYIDGSYKGTPKMSGTSQSAAIYTGRLACDIKSNR